MKASMKLRLEFFFFTVAATTEIYTLSLHDALPISLQNNGGPTQTMIPGGVAVDGGDDCVLNQSCSSDNLSFNLTTDQRGFARKLGGHVDIGAVEIGRAHV